MLSVGRAERCSLKQTILCINGGSSSLKFHVYEMGLSGSGESERLLALGAVEGIGQGNGRIWFTDAEGRSIVDRLLDTIEYEGAVEEALLVLADKSLPPMEAIGHRVVHGGTEYRGPRLITPGVMSDLQDHVAWAPLHMPITLRVIEAMEAERPGLPQVACFDTGFHASMPEVARRLPLPDKFYEQGVRKYGFHGLSYEYVLNALGKDAGGRLVMAHLGNGCSMAACLDGKPVDTTMGMTPLGGLMMGTRSGDIDPGVAIYLVREWGYDDEMLERLLDTESGLKGVSGQTADMEALLESRASGDASAAMAIEMFCYQARKTVGALAAALGGLDELVFTAGIGENAPLIRALICHGLDHLGIELDPAKNREHAWTISTEQSRCRVFVVPTNEDLMIARHTYRLVFGGALPIVADERELT
jgi:acetate kinase